MGRTPEGGQFVPEPKENASREQLVLDTITRIEFPFMSALQRNFGADRGWRICGPASVSLSRVLNSFTDVPIYKGGSDEHIELEIGIFDPKTDPRRKERVEEQTYIRYYNGQGDVYYIDPIYGLLMEGRADLAGAIQVEKYKVDEIDQALIARHNLYPFDPNHDGIELGGFFANDSPTQRLSDYRDVTAIHNDERATLNRSLGDSGEMWRFEGEKIRTVIKDIAPDWKEDELAVVKRLTDLMAVIMAEQSIDNPNTLLPNLSEKEKYSKIGSGIGLGGEIDYRKLFTDITNNTA